MFNKVFTTKITNSVDKNKRDIQLDLIRVISMILVIGVHCAKQPFSAYPMLQKTFIRFMLTCNGMFYMLSGRFALNTKCNTKQEYKKYYINKIVSVVFPMFLVTFGIEFLKDIYKNRFSLNILQYFKKVYECIMTTNAQGHMWFMYPLIGMLLGAPFLAKMLDRMEDWELKLLFSIGVGWYVVRAYFAIDFNIGFSYNCWFLQDFTLYFFAGYFCKRIINGNNKKYFYILGVIGFLITIFGENIFPTYQNSTDITPAFLFYTIALFLFIQYEFKIKTSISKNIIAFLAKHSYAIYLLHFTLGIVVVNKVVKVDNEYLYFGGHMIVCLITSLCFAMLMNYIVVFPIQKYIKKKVFK